MEVVELEEEWDLFYMNLHSTGKVFNLQPLLGPEFLLLKRWFLSGSHLQPFFPWWSGKSL